MSDPHANNVVLFLKGEGSDGSTSIVDSSVNPKTVTVHDNVHITSDVVADGVGSIFFDGSAQSHLTIPKSNDFDFSDQDFTIECTIYLIEHRWQIILSTGQTNSPWYSIRLYIEDNGQVGIIVFAQDGQRFAVSSDILLSLNQLYALAVIRSADTLFILIDGVVVGTTVIFGAVRYLTSDPLQIGTGYDSASNANQRIYFKGYLDNIRITKGIARPPSELLLLASFYSISGTITENVPITQWMVSFHNHIDRSLLDSILVTGNVYIYDQLLSDAPVYVCLTPAVGDRWRAQKAYAVDDFLVYKNESGFVQLFVCSSAGMSGTTEPVWDISAPTLDGADVVWSYVSVLPKPLIHGPLFPELVA